MRQTDEYKKGTVAAHPGKDYIAAAAAKPGKDEYHLFPDDEVCDTFRHAWVLVRKVRPQVVVIQGLRRPCSSRSAEENAKYCS